MNTKLENRSAHGGDIYRNRIRFDFSVNVNPLGMPKAVRAALYEAVENCGLYPDPEAEKLKRSAAGYLGTEEEELLFGNGASELFMALVHGIKPKKTVIPVPSFYGYEYAARAAGSEILFYEMKESDGFCLTRDFYSVLEPDVDLLFLANPNNPTGRLSDRELLLDVLRRCREKGIWVVLDESFIEFCKGRVSLLGEREAFDNLLVVRSFTKNFCMPGVRLGCLICGNVSLREKISAQLPEWNLSCFAQAAGCVCAGQTAFLEETAAYTEKERLFLEKGLRERGFRVLPSDVNFILFYSEKPLYERLLKQGVLIRDCTNFKGLDRGYYRVAVKTRAENKILLKLLYEMGKDAGITAADGTGMEDA